jgi:16S rRNA (cytidine1402-2'-O)-methyltransferase
MAFWALKGYHISMSEGKLFVCATPIGNLKDITLRVLETLKEVNLIAAEDTRQTRKLLTRYGIKTPLTSYHEHNEVTKGKELLRKLEGGQDIALVSDAGMPGLADPGHRLIKTCLEVGIGVEVLPGPSAFLTALVVSGLPTDSFIYRGFLPRKKSERVRALKEFSNEKRTLVFYESPHRLEGLLVDALEVLGDRRMVLARELTKKFEEIIRGSISQVLERLREGKLKGEMVVVMEGVGKEKSLVDIGSLGSRVIWLMREGFTRREAVKKIAEEEGVSPRMLYEAVKRVKISREKGD